MLNVKEKKPRAPAYVSTADAEEANKFFYACRKAKVIIRAFSPGSTAAKKFARGKAMARRTSVQPVARQRDV